MTPRSPEIGFENGESVVVLLAGSVDLAELLLEQREVILGGLDIGLGSSVNHLLDHEIIAFVAVRGSGDDVEKESEDGERKLETIHLRLKKREREGDGLI